MARVSKSTRPHGLRLVWLCVASSLLAAGAYVPARRRRGPPPLRAIHQEREFDLVVIGGGPVGISAANRAASLGLSAILVDATPPRQFQFTGPTGLYSKALRDAALRIDVPVLRRMGLGDAAIWAQVSEMVDRIVRKCGDDNARGLAVSRVPHLRGFGVVKPVGGAVEVDVKFRRTTKGGSAGTTVRGKHCVVATGSRAVRFDGLDYDAADAAGRRRVYDSDSVKGLSFLPRRVVIVGGGIIAVEYARIFAALAADVTLVVRSADLPKSLRRVGIDAGLAGALQADLRDAGVDILFETEIAGAALAGAAVAVALRDGRTLEADVLLTATGRAAVTRGVFDDAALVDGLLAPNGDLLVDGELKTVHRAVSGAGDVVGAPQLASTGIAQAEAAVDCVYGDGCALGDVSPAGLLASTARYPVGIWTVPELAFCGLAAEAAADRGLDVVVGVAHYADTVRGHVRESDASTRSCLKLVVARDAPHTILGVHLFGDDAAELVHFGTTLVQASMTADDAAVTCYAAVTYHELYKLAAQDAKATILEDRWRSRYAALVDRERRDGAAPSAANTSLLHRQTLDAALCGGLDDGDRQAIARALFAGAKTCTGALFVKRAMRLRGCLADAVCFAAEGE